MRAQDIMATDVVTFSPDTSIVAAAKTMLDRRISGAPVVDASGAVKGVISEGDLLFRAETGTEHRRSWWLRLIASPEDRAIDYVKEHGGHVGDVMTRNVISVHRDTPVDEIAAMLERNHIKRLPVVDDGKVVGIVSRADIIRALASAASVGVTPAKVDDRALREKALTALRAVDGVSDLHVNVVVSGGEIHLWGYAETKAQGNALRVACENVPGAGKVVSHLAVFHGVAT